MSESKKDFFTGEKIKPNELKRFEFSNLLPNEKGQIWNKECLFNKEYEHIKKYFREKIPQLMDELNKNWKHKDKGEEDFLSQKWEESIKKDLERIYTNYTIKIEEIERIKDGYYKNHCPEEKNIVIWNLVFWLSIVGETSILLAQSILGGGFNPMILLFAFLLALGGWFCGKFLGVLFWRSHARKIGIYNPKDDSVKLADNFMLVVGCILILFVATVRAVFGREISETGLDVNSVYVFSLTVILGLVVATTEGKLIYEEKKRDRALGSQQEGLQMFATQQHKQKLNNGEYRRLFYEEFYKETKKQEKGEIK